MLKRRQILADVRYGAIVRQRGDWGVVCRGCVIDFWWSGREVLKPWTVVEVLA